MGILHLKRHLQPYASAVWIGEERTTSESDGVKRITSVVIDGPSLVYHVYYCLLSRMEDRVNAVDVQPSSNEVSIGVMRFLLHLRDLNVAVEKILFDGALPLLKRQTRLERLENLRDKLEKLCHSNPTGFHISSIRRDPVKIEPRMVFGGGHSAATTRKVPANPFMVATVIEDLKHRWDWRHINEYAFNTARIVGDPDELPWADITHVVPGEADIYTAEAAKASCAPVLTGDSDFLIHDLGPNGTVIFTDSIETVQFRDAEPGTFRVRANELGQDTISQKFGITNLQQFGFELKYSPTTSLSTLVQRCKSDSDEKKSSDLYVSFLKEYEAPAKRHVTQPELVLLDPRISEFCLQYAIPELRSDAEPPNVYLPFLTENYGRRCAWVEGSWIRSLAYSLFDLAFPKANVSQCVVEYTRRGGRVCPTPVGLLGRKNIDTAAEPLIQRLSSVVTPYNNTLIYWKTFALSEIWRPSEKNNNPVLGPADIRRFLEEGYSDSRLSWNDIHLDAQVQAVLYSLKILKDLATAALPKLENHAKETGSRIAEALSMLPPLHMLSLSRSELKSRSRPEGSNDSAVQTLSGILKQQREADAIADEHGRQTMPNSDKTEEPRVTEEPEFHMTHHRRRGKKRAASIATTVGHQQVKKSMNIYDILEDTS